MYTSGPTPAGEAYDEGERALTTVGPAMAREHFAKALELDPSMTRARVALAFTLELTGDWPESHEFYHQALEQTDDPQDVELRLAALRGLSGLALLRMNLDEADAFLRTDLQLADDTACSQSWNLRGLLLVHDFRGDSAGRETFAAKARALDTREERGGAAALLPFADRHRVTPWISELPTGTDELRKALSGYRQAADLGNQAVVLHQLANRPELSTAERRQLHEEALRLFHEIGHRRGVARVLADIGFLDVMELEEARATESLDSSLEIYRELGEVLAVAKGRLGRMGWRRRCDRRPSHTRG